MSWLNRDDRQPNVSVLRQPLRLRQQQHRPLLPNPLHNSKSIPPLSGDNNGLSALRQLPLANSHPLPPSNNKLRNSFTSPLSSNNSNSNKLNRDLFVSRKAQYPSSSPLANNRYPQHRLQQRAAVNLQQVGFPMLQHVHQHKHSRHQGQKAVTQEPVAVGASRGTRSRMPLSGGRRCLRIGRV